MSTDNISGYCLLSMPSSDVQPLGLLTLQKDGVANLTEVRIDDLFIKSELPLPTVSKDYSISSAVDKSVTMELAVDSNLNLLEGLLKFLKVSGSFKLQKNSSVKVHLTDAKKSKINEFKLDAFINSAKISEASPNFLEMLRNDELFVITEILKCRSYSLDYADSRKVDAGVNATAATAGEASASLQKDDANKDTQANDGEDFITIGVKAFRIFYLKDKKTGVESFRIRLDDKIKTMKGEEDFSGDSLPGGTPVVITK